MPARATSADPDEGRAAVEREDWTAVQQLVKRRLRKSAIDTFSHRYLGLALQGLSLQKESLEAYERALKIYPNDVVILINFSNILSGQGQNLRAYELSKRAAQLAPGLARAWISMLWPCYMLAKHQEGVNAAEKAKLLPMTQSDRMMLLNNLGTNLRDLGRLDEALAVCREAIALAPEWNLPYINLMLFLQSKPDTTAMELREAGELYASKFELPWMNQWPKFEERNADPHRKLRIGFLSPDFNCHSVMYFVEGILPQLDRRRYEVVALYLQNHEDIVTERVKRHTDEFYRLASLGDQALAARIQALEIDVLIDMAGHTAGSGLRAMVHKPAPVQVTWLGYPGTTGLKSIDWRITDVIADMEGADAEYVEQLFRLPDIFCVYRPMSRFPLYRYQPLYQVRPTPALQNGYITFGSCNNLSKLTDPVLCTWARVLKAVPNARLLVEGKGFEDKLAQDEFEQRCVAQGIPSDRLILVPRDSAQQYLTYHRIDIALDCFPLTGGTTSTDLLWMGVPLVSMNGTAFRSRIGVTVLHALGHPEWVAETVDDYVRLATKLASDTNALNTRRLAQRIKMENSPAMDERKFVQHFESALRSMWHHWCAVKAFPGDTDHQVQARIEWEQRKFEPKAAQVTVAPGRHVSLHQAHEHLQNLTAQALAVAPREVILLGKTEPVAITHKAWLQVLEWCEYLLDSLPNEPLALATLAEIEHAHGRTDFAATYLHYAQLALSKQLA